MNDCNNELLEKVNKDLLNSKKLDSNDLNNVSGGNEPEEFGWDSKGYVTPEKEHDNNDDWNFSPIADKDNK